MKKNLAVVMASALIFLFAVPETFVEASTIDFGQVENVRVATYLGSGNRGFSEDTRLTSRFTLPYGVIPVGEEVIVFDTHNNLIRRVNDESITTLAGSVLDMDDSRFPQGGRLDGDLETALLNRPTSGVFNSRGELIFADSGNNAVRRIVDGNVITIGGDTRLFNNPMAIAIDSQDNVYVADTLHNSIRIIEANGNVRTFAGTPGRAGFADGEVGNALFREPSGIAVSSDGSVIYVSDTGNHKIRRIENGIVTTVAGITEQVDEDDFPIGAFRNGSADQAMFNLPMGITIANDNLIVADRGNNMIRLINAQGEVSTLAGNGDPGDVDGTISQSRLSAPSYVYFNEGTLYIADTNNNKIKVMRFDNTVTE